MHFISLGAGVQSTTMLLMAAHGEITEKIDAHTERILKPKYAIFADTGWEPKKVYNHLNWLKDEAAKFGIKVIITDNGNIRNDILKAKVNKKRLASLPFYVLNPDGTKGIVRRQCTNEYKIVPVRRTIRKLLGYEPRQRIKENIYLWMGISTDEIQRVKPSRERWITNNYPLIEKGMNRIDCMNWMRKNGYPIPPKSSCVGCPFHSDEMWLDMKKNDPEAWNDAVYIDRSIRNLPHFKGQLFLHPSCKPLDEVNLGEDQGELDLFINECEGMCGI